MAVCDAHVFPGFLTPVLTQLFFPKPQTTFLTCFYRGERRKYAGKKVCLNRGSNSQPPDHDRLNTEPPGRGLNPVEEGLGHGLVTSIYSFSTIFSTLSNSNSIIELLSFWSRQKFCHLLHG